MTIFLLKLIYETFSEKKAFNAQQAQYSAAPPQSQAGKNEAGQSDLTEALQDKTLYIRVPSSSDRIMHRIGLLLIMFPGTGRLVIWCEKEKKRVGAKCLLHPALIAELSELLGTDSVIVK